MRCCDSPKKVLSGLNWPRNNFMWGVCMSAAQSTTLGNSVVFVCVFVHEQSTV